MADILSGGPGQDVVQTIVGSENADKLAIAWFVVPWTNALSLMMGDMSSIVIPLIDICDPDSIDPERDFEILDGGASLRCASRKAKIAKLIEKYRKAA